MGKQLINIIGKKFSELTVLYRGKNDRFGKPTWVCQCYCGTVREFQGQNLRSGNSKCCGCRKPGNTLRPYEALYNQFVHNVKRWRTIDLPYEQFLEFTNITECHYCGTSVVWSKFGISKNGAAYNLDRKNNSLGYSKENCVVCCGPCNFKKAAHFTYEQFLQIGNLIRSWETP